MMEAFAADVDDDVIPSSLTAGVVARDTEKEERGTERGGDGEEQGVDQEKHYHQRAAPEIKAIDRSSVARICSGQVVIDLATAVKELVENALDAGARQVEVKLRDWGLELIEVSDNGSGIAPKNYQALTLKYHTSKLSSFTDLQSVVSFGFRGEALSSLCEIAGGFEVTTRVEDESIGARIVYGRTGAICSQTPMARQPGTTITVFRLFEPLPVRRAEFKRTVPKQSARLLRVLQAYALVATGVRITCSNIKGAKGNRQQLLGTQGSPSIRDNVVSIFGAAFASSLLPLHLEVEVEGGRKGGEGGGGEEEEKGEEEEEEAVTKIVGLVSKAGEGVGRSDNDRQFIFLNSRPVDLPRVTRVLNEVWRQYEMKHKPAVILNIQAPPGTFDVNVTPDKREIFLTQEALLLVKLKEKLQSMWGIHDHQRTFQVAGGQGNKAAKALAVSLSMKNAGGGSDGGGGAAAAAAAAATGEGVAKGLVEEGKSMEAVEEEEAAREEGEGGEEEAFVASAAAVTPTLAPRKEREAEHSEEGRMEEDTAEEYEDEVELEEEEGGSGISSLPSVLCRGRRHRNSDMDSHPRSTDPCKPSPSSSSLLRTNAGGSADGGGGGTRGGEGGRGGGRGEGRGGGGGGGGEGGGWSGRMRGRGGAGGGSTGLITRFLARNNVDVKINVPPPSSYVLTSPPSSPSSSSSPSPPPPPLPRDRIHRKLNAFLAPSFSRRQEGEGGRDEEEEDNWDTENREEEEEEKEEEEEVMEEEGEVEEEREEDEQEEEEMEEEEEEEGEALSVGQTASLPPSPLPKRARREGAVREKVEGRREGGRGGGVCACSHTLPPTAMLVDDGEGEEEGVKEEGKEGGVDEGVLTPAGKGLGGLMLPGMDGETQLRKEKKESGEMKRPFVFDVSKALGRARRGRREGEGGKAMASVLSSATWAKGKKGGREDNEKESVSIAGRDTEEAARVFSRVLTKMHLKRLVVLGQFNLGFIIARIGADVFILDQHACDEKYNFETLQSTTTLHEQRLIAPKPLELSAMEEVIILEHLHTFKQNGFSFLVDPEAGPMQRVKLLSLPYSKGVQFGLEDIHELASLLGDSSFGFAGADGEGAGEESGKEDRGQGGPSVRLPKIRAMFASRACRMSIMIGKALTKPQMQKVVSNLAEIEQPWNCPHGRPTMRHLVDLTTLQGGEGI